MMHLQSYKQQQHAKTCQECFIRVACEVYKLCTIQEKMIRKHASSLCRCFSSITIPEVNWEKIVTKGYTIKTLEGSEVEAAAPLLARCFTQIEPAASYKKTAYETGFEFYYNLLSSLWKERLSAVMLNGEGEVVGMKISRNAAQVLRNPPEPPSASLDPGFRAVQLMRRRNYMIMSEYYKERGWLNKKLLHIFLAAVHPKVRGLRVGSRRGFFSQDPFYNLQCFQERGETRNIVLCLAQAICKFIVELQVQYNYIFSVSDNLQCELAPINFL
eukprot:TRINITY_DN139_c0_g2_i2.p1 TRINITY_DN139_c0_g2~~TRINITY_DN139_c0_g2_i2.p1  ORF type:complete len:287 (+),score=-10.77 TRINITY_DN139_c0_g2_i2:46-861(+)